MRCTGTAWADLDDGRALCLDCLHTLVADTADCQPLYDDILRFYARMGMPLPGGVRPPMMLVPSDALNQAGAVGAGVGRGSMSGVAWEPT